MDQPDDTLQVPDPTFGSLGHPTGCAAGFCRSWELIKGALIPASIGSHPLFPSKIMSQNTIWDSAAAHALVEKNTFSVGVESPQGCLESQGYPEDSFMGYRPSRPSIHVETAMPQLLPYEYHNDNHTLDFHQRQLQYINSFRQDIPGFACWYHGTQFVNVSEEPYEVVPYWAFPQSPSTSSNSTGSTVVSPQTGRHLSFSPSRRLSDSPSMPALSSMETPQLGAQNVDFGGHGSLSTIVDRAQELDMASQRLFKTCGPNPTIQSFALDLFESPQFRMRQPITWELADRLLEKIKHDNVTNGKGKRGAPRFYKCLWGSCSEQLPRKLHALEHIMNHIGNRSHVCSHCAKGFVRKNELKKHSPCKAFKRKLSCLHRETVGRSGAPQSPATPLNNDPSDCGPWYNQTGVAESSCLSYAELVRETTVYQRLLPHGCSCLLDGKRWRIS